MTISNPGILQKNDFQTWIDIIESGKKLEKMCPYCKIELNKFSKHCFLCNNCIDLYDHHCHWINNCVGSWNKPYFIAFIISLWFNLVMDCFITIQIFINNSKDGVSGNFILENIFFKFIYGGTIFLVSLFFIVPVSYLIYIQFKSKDTQREVQTYLKEIKKLENDFEDEKKEKLLD